MAALRNEVACFRALVDDPRTDVNYHDLGQSSIFYICCCQGLLEMVEVLMTRGDLDVNLQGTNGATPLFMAGQEGHHAVVRRLLENPTVDPAIPMVDGQSVVSVMLELNRVIELQLLFALADDFPLAFPINVKKGLELNLQTEYELLLRSLDQETLSPRELGVRKGSTEAVALYDRFTENRRETKWQCWNDLGLQGKRLTRWARPFLF